MHAFICDAASQVGACQPVHAAQNEVHDLHRRVDNPQRLGRLGKGQGEEPLIEFGDDPLLAGRIVNARAALVDRLVEALQLLGLRLQVGSIQYPEHPAHHLRHRVLGREVVAVEDRIEDRLGHQVLREHVDRGFRGDRVVEIGSQSRQEMLKLARHLGVLHPLGQALTVTGRNVGNILGPLLPVTPRADLLDQAGVDRLPPLAERPQVEGRLLMRRSTGGVAVVGGSPKGVDDGDLVRLGLVEIDLVDHGVEALIVSAQRLKHLPHHPEGVIVRQDVLGRHPGWDRHRQDDVAVLLTRRQAHYPSHRLDDVHLGLARGQEHDRIQGRDVHTLGQAPGVGQDSAGHGCLLRLRCRRCLPGWRRRAQVAREPGQQAVALHDVHGAVHVANLHGAQPLLSRGIGVDAVRVVGQLRHLGFVGEREPVVLGHVPEGRGEALRGLNVAGEGHRRAHRLDVPAVVGRVHTALGQGVPAADDPGGVVERELAVLSQGGLHLIGDLVL